MYPKSVGRATLTHFGDRRLKTPFVNMLHSVNSPNRVWKDKVDTYFNGSGGIGPLEFPNQTIVPFLFTAAKDPS